MSLRLVTNRLDQPITVVKANPLATSVSSELKNSMPSLCRFEALNGTDLKMKLPGVFDIQKYSKQKLTEIPTATQRLINPDEFPIYITTKLADLQEKLLEADGQ